MRSGDGGCLAKEPTPRNHCLHLYRFDPVTWTRGGYAKGRADFQSRQDYCFHMELRASEQRAIYCPLLCLGWEYWQLFARILCEVARDLANIIISGKII